MRVSILVPVFEEEATVGELLRKLLASSFSELGCEREILVCDDGSKDHTAQVLAELSLREPELRVFSHATNRGKGHAIRTLLEHATGDAVLIQDADLEYDVADSVELVRLFLAGHPAVYGSRFLARRVPEGMRLSHYVANRVLTHTANLLYGLEISDEATCSKLVDARLLREMKLTCERFEFCPEVTAKLGRMGVPIVEAPVRYRARDRASGKKVRWHDGFVAMGVLLRHRWR
ncbi:MAG: glycosyltransferase family 2 protein [Polyangiaceae bacterium]